MVDLSMLNYQMVKERICLSLTISDTLTKVRIDSQWCSSIKTAHKFDFTRTSQNNDIHRPKLTFNQEKHRKIMKHHVDVRQAKRNLIKIQWYSLTFINQSGNSPQQWAWLLIASSKWVPWPTKYNWEPGKVGMYSPFKVSRGCFRNKAENVFT